MHTAGVERLLCFGSREGLEPRPGRACVFEAVVNEPDCVCESHILIPSRSETVIENLWNKRCRRAGEIA